MILSPPPDAYDKNNEAQTRAALISEDARNVKNTDYATITKRGVVRVDGTTVTADADGTIHASGSVSPADPTATAGLAAINGAASTFMRSDAAPAVQPGSSSQKGIVQVDGTTITASGGVISAVQPSVPAGANPTATASDTAVNGSASTFMRSDAAPAVQKGSSSAFGIVKVDNATITAASGVISASASGLGVPAAANPTATAKDTAVNGSASTYMRSDAAPAIQKASASQFGIVEVDGSTITAASGVISASASGLGVPAAANPTATASDTAVNGSASTFMRSDAAPAVQKASSSQFGIVEVDGVSITASNGVITARGGGGGGGQFPVSGWLATGSPATTTHSFAAWGFAFTPLTTLNFYAFAWVLTTVTGGVYKVGFAPFNTSTKQITSPITYCTGTYADASPGPNRPIWLSLSSPFTMTAGQTYIIVLVRTDSTTTVSQTVNNNVANNYAPGIFFSGSPTYHLASLAPTTSDTWTGPSQFGINATGYLFYYW